MVWNDGYDKATSAYTIHFFHIAFCPAPCTDIIYDLKNVDTVSAALLPLYAPSNGAPQLLKYDHRCWILFLTCRRGGECGGGEGGARSRGEEERICGEGWLLSLTNIYMIFVGGCFISTPVIGAHQWRECLFMNLEMLRNFALGLAIN